MYSLEWTDVALVEVLHLVVPGLHCRRPVLLRAWSYALCVSDIQILAYVKPGWNRKCEASVSIPQTAL